MEWNTTSKTAAAALVFGVLFFVLSIVLMGASPIDIGLLSTTVVLVLFGVFGILLGKAQTDAAS